MAKSLGWKRLDHLSLAVPDVAQSAAFYRKLFGATPDHDFRSEEEGWEGTLLHLPGRQLQLEFLQPVGPDSFLHRFLAGHGPGVHHITVEVDSIDDAVTFLREEMGVEPVREIFSDGKWRQTFIHPRDTGGLLVQLFEWEPGKGPGA